MFHASQQATLMDLLDQLSTQLVQVQQIQSQILQTHEQNLAFPSPSFLVIGDFRDKIEQIHELSGSTNCLIQTNQAEDNNSRRSCLRNRGVPRRDPVLSPNGRDLIRTTRPQALQSRDRWLKEAKDSPVQCLGTANYTSRSAVQSALATNASLQLLRHPSSYRWNTSATTTCGLL